MQIHFAAKRGDLAEVRRQLSLGVPVDGAEYREGWSPLMCACASARCGLDVVAYLISRGADPNYTSAALGDTPLRLSAMSGSLEKVQYLLDNGARADSISPSGYTPLIDAMYGGGPQLRTIIQLLVKHGCNPDQTTQFGESAIKVAWKRCLFDAVAELIELGTSVSALEMSELMRAVVFGSLDDVRKALASGEELSAQDCWGRTALHIAVSAGWLEAVEAIVAAGGDIEQRGPCGKTNLMYAVRGNHAEMLRWLIARGASVKEVDDFGDDALMVAASYGAADCCRELLENGADILHADETGSCAIDRATTAEVVRVLASYGAGLDHVNGEGYCLLRIAAEEGREDIVEVLLRRGASTEPEGALEYPLHSAVEADELGCVRLLLAAGADPDARNIDGDPALMFVRSTACLQLLEEYGADFTITDDMGRSAACRLRDAELLERVIALGAKADLPDGSPSIPLIASAEYSAPERVRVLLDNGANPNRRDRSGRTALMAAAQAGSLECTAILLDHGASTDMTDEDGRTALFRAAAPEAYIPPEVSEVSTVALHDAAEHLPEELRLPGFALEHTRSSGDPDTRLKIVRMLLSAGADLNHRDTNGTTPLMLAAAFGTAAVVRALLELGGDASDNDFDGLNALDYAETHPNDDVRAAILRLLRVTIT
jgi:ankyrin repeat protein